MSHTQKEKLETCTDASIQILPDPEESSVTVADDYIEVTLDKKRKEASKPLYLRRI